jgi:multiple sugar transport system permease protein
MTLSTKARDAVAGYLFILPNMIGFLLFLAFPVVASLFISAAEWNLITEPVFIGINNFIALFQDSYFWQSLGNTAYFSLFSVLLGIGMSLFLAVLLTDPRVAFSGFVKSAVFLPVIFSTVSVALIWQWILDSHIGMLNRLIAYIHLGPIPWLTDPSWSMPSVIMVAVWRQIGYNMVIFLAALQGVPVELYEASDIDGANPWRKFWNVTWPMISPSTFFVLVTSIINSFQVFDITTVLTNGGPANSTNTIIMMVYQYAFQNFKMGYASAAAYVLFAIVLLITAFQSVVSKRWVHT